MATSQRVNAALPTEAVSLSPLARVVRTVIQVVLAVAASIPVILASTSLTGNQITKVETIVAGFVAVASGVQNVLEYFGVVPTTGGVASSLLPGARGTASPVPEAFTEAVDAQAS